MPYRMNKSSKLMYRDRMGCEPLEEVRELKYLGSMQYKHGTLEGDIKDKCPGKEGDGSLRRIIKEKSKTMNV